MAKRSKNECKHPKHAQIILGSTGYWDKLRSIWVTKVRWQCNICKEVILEVQHFKAKV